MPVPAIEFDWTRKPSLAPIDGNGPTLVCDRVGTFPAYTLAHRDLCFQIPDNTPKFQGFICRDNRLPHNDDFNNVVWNKINCSVAKNATDREGNANAAWTITDNATSGYHCLQQDFYNNIDVIDYYYGAMQVVDVDVTNSTARYMYLAVDNPPGADEIALFDLQEKRMLVGDTQIFNSRMFVFDNGWVRVEMWGDCNTNRSDFICGIASGPTYAECQYSGSGDTLIVAKAYVSDYFHGYINHDQNVGYPGALGADWEFAYHSTTFKQNEFVNGSFTHLNEDFSFYAGSGFNRMGVNKPIANNFNDYLHTFTVTGNGRSSPQASKFFDTVGGDERTWVTMMLDGKPESLPQALRITGKDATCYHTYKDSFYTAHNKWKTRCYSIFLEECRVKPRGPVVLIDDTDHGGQYLEPDRIAFKISDFKPDPHSGRPRLDFYVTPLQSPPDIRFGLGVDGNPDTGDFVLSGGMINEGPYPFEFLPNTSGDVYDDSTTLIRRDGMLSIHGQGLVVDQARTNLVLYNMSVPNAVWSKTNCTFNARIQSNFQGNVGQRFYADGTGTGAVSVAQTVTMTTSTKHTFAFAVDVYLYGPFFYFGIENHGALDLECWMDLRDGSVTTTGADVDRVEVRRLFSSWYVTMVFTSDSVDTTGDILFGGSPTDGVKVIDLENEYSYNYFSAPALYEGEPIGSFQHIPTTTVPVASAADVISTNDLSDLSGSAHSAVVQFKAPNDVQDDYTVLSLWSSATARVTLRISGGNLHFIGVNTTTQWDISTAVSANQELIVAVGWEANSIAMAVNGELAGTDSSATIPTVSNMNVGSDHADVEQLNSIIRKLKIFNSRESNETLTRWSRDAVTDDQAFFARSALRRVGRAASRAA